jgi:S-adenosylmethionine uptake transporter
MRFRPGETPLPIAFGICCAGVALFSVMDATVKSLSLAIGLFNALFWRSVAGTLLGLTFTLIFRRPWPAPAVLRIHILRGVVVAVMALLFFFGLQRLPMAEAIGLSFIAPLIALYLAALLLKERVGNGAVVASALGLVGVAVILSGRLRGNYDEQALLGAGSVLLSATLFAWNLIIQKQQADVSSPLEVAFFQNLVMLSAFGLGAPFFATLPDLGHVPLIAGAAMLAFTSLMALSWAYARAEAQYLIPVEYTAFIWAAIIGWLTFGERLTLTTVAGTVLIVIGCLIAARPSRAPPHIETSAA